MKIFATKKGKIIIGVTVVLLILAAIILLRIFLRKDYRSISVADIRGKAVVTGENNTGDVYKGQRFYGGDDVTVLEKSDLTMCIDNSKYLYAEENTHFRIENSSTKNASRIRIVLDQGSELNELTEKLKADDSYEVDTPNATMSVRGTKFRVTVYTDQNGTVYTLLEVLEGVVLTESKTLSGRYEKAGTEIVAGQNALIAADENTVEFIKNEKGEEVLLLNHDTLPGDSMERLLFLLKEYGVMDNNLSAQSKAEPKAEDEKTNEAHTHTQGEFEVSIEPGCETKGERVAKCTECGEVMASEEIDALGHQYSKWKIEKKAGCTTEGTESRKCDRCGKTETRTVPASEHNWGEWTLTVGPNCVSEGVEERICSVCGEKESRSVPATGVHNFGNTVVDKEASCTEDGLAHSSCTVCGARGSDTVIAKKDHEYELTGQEPIDAQSYYEVYKCKNCNATYKAKKNY